MGASFTQRTTRTTSLTAQQVNRCSPPLMLTLSTTAWKKSTHLWLIPAPTFSTSPPQPTESKTMKNQILDILTALAIAAALLIGALAYFDILTK
jgi:hypothetical protein